MGLTADNFAGGGGASLGMERALGRPVSIAVNHDENAILMHRANHPATRHYCENVWDLDPAEVCGGAPLDVAWFSPDCKDFSKAKGGRPVSKRVRGLAWVVLRWAARARPRVIFLENVEEFRGWGPLTRSGRRCKRRAGLTFDKWVAQLQDLGYVVEWRELRACDYGAPTIRKRLFVVARRDGEPIVWPAPTHGPGAGLEPYRTAAGCIDWAIPCPSIFERKRPLAEATMRRIARGVKRFVLEAEQPFIIRTDMQSGAARNGVHCIDEPVRTITTGGGMAVVMPHLSRQFGNSVGSAIADPVGTVTAGGGGKTALVAAFMEQANTGMTGHPMGAPLSTIVQKGCTQRLVAACLNHQYGSNTNGGNGDLRVPHKTVTTGGHHALVYAFLIKYFGQGGQWQGLESPLHTATAKGRFGLVTVDIGGEPYVITDIGMRMLTPRELFRAQGFPDTYEIAPMRDGKPLTKTAQVEKCGNSVSPQVADALVGANVGGAERLEEAAA